MSSQIYKQYGQNNGDMISKFNQFKQSFTGNPQQMIQQMLNSGKITQEQLDNAVRQANQLMRIMK